MRPYPLIIVFALCFLYMQITLVIAPSLRLLFFAPFLILSAKDLPHTKQLFPAFISGFTLDLFAAGVPFGFYTLLSCVTMFLSFFWVRSYFNKQSIIYLTSGLLFIWTQTVLEALLSSFFKLPLRLDFDWFYSHLLVFPLLDIAYFILGIVLPLKLITHPVKDHE